MPLKLAPGYADPATGATLPSAIGRVVDAQFHLRPGIARVELAIYASAAAETARMTPVSERALYLTPAEIQYLHDQLTTALYTVLAQRAEFAGSTVV